jgi:hypothetical protein
MNHLPSRTTPIARSFLCLLALVCAVTGGIGAAQTSQHPQPTTKRYCEADGNYCFRYPISWTEVGAEYPGNGVVIAPPQKQERSQWDTITVVQMVLANDDEQNHPLSFYIDRATSGAREAGQDFQTVQRQEGSVNGHPTESLTALYREKDSGREWMEKLVFLQGDEGTYSVVLKCAPANFARLEPALKSILQSWSFNDERHFEVRSQTGSSAGSGGSSSKPQNRP